jgi:hypothetical protein
MIHQLGRILSVSLSRIVFIAVECPQIETLAAVNMFHFKIQARE